MIEYKQVLVEQYDRQEYVRYHPFHRPQVSGTSSKERKKNVFDSLNTQKKNKQQKKMNISDR